MSSGNQVLFIPKKQHVLIFSSAISFHFLFLFFLALGPALPKILHGHEMLEIQGDVFIFGGNYGGANSAIYQLSCSSSICSWATLNQGLKVGRMYTVAIPLPSDYTCITSSK